ncbi:fructose-bisphosphate aldolase, class II [Nocardia amikacinitolerans]|uniref:class II fructose-bisphosphate aldolase n=1 Tax=Nocardia amikacinitolerans TaxID=756689 RepID=UPI0008364FCA|nr:class II fructose-bisphosphate aldolase [Nocardia amikacinitolerans]MCP2320895.1 fructose-bisphosphate aldolase, class II [Nocardia amikacinitolerans]
MPLTPVPDLIAAARPGGLGAFNVITLEHAEAIAAAAEDAKRPVVMQISENTVRYHGSLAPLALACLRIAADSSASIAVHLDHATSVELVTAAAELGIGSVMFDASTLDYAANVAATAKVARRCRERGVFVEAELGEIGGKDGAHAPGVRTDPDEAVEFVAATGVDALAVAVGSAHAMHARTAELDLELIATLAAKVPVPLVLHGSSGVPDNGLRAAVEHGMTKVNIATRLNVLMTEAVRSAVIRDADLSDPRKYLAPGRAAVRAEVEHFLHLLANRPDDPHRHGPPR